MVPSQPGTGFTRWNAGGLISSTDVVRSSLSDAVPAPPDQYSMNTPFGEMIAASSRIALSYLDRLTDGIDAADFGKLARCGGTVIDANHPAFIVGHLSIYPSRIIDELGGDAGRVAPGDVYENLFSPSAECRDDPDATIYPPRSELIQRCRSGYEAAIAALQSADDDAFRRPNANEKMRAKFATTGAMHGFYVGGHFMMHMGQLSTWRRAMGLPPA